MPNSFVSLDIKSYLLMLPCWHDTKLVEYVLLLLPENVQITKKATQNQSQNSFDSTEQPHYWAKHATILHTRWCVYWLEGIQGGKKCNLISPFIWTGLSIYLYISWSHYWSVDIACFFCISQSQISRNSDPLTKEDQRKQKVIPIYSKAKWVVLLT